jgi:hypothetical protein
MSTLCVLLLPAEVAAQPAGGMQEVLERIARLERDNQTLRAEVAELRAEVMRRGSLTARAQSSETEPPPAGSGFEAEGQSSATPPDDSTGAAPEPTVEERLEIAERRIEEHSAIKLETSQRFPVRLSGILVANLYRNGPHAGGFDTPYFASATAGRHTAGMTFRQSIIGFDYQGGQSLLGAKVRGSIFMDFYDGLTESGSGYSPIRLRTASFGLDWSDTSISFGLDKPIFAPRDPNSFSYLGIAPLIGAGNLWRWQPQVRVEHRIKLSPNDQLRPQVALLQTYEDIGAEFSYQAGLERRRPGVQGRFEYSHRFDDDRRLEFAPAFHASTTHVNGMSLPSRVFSLDWFANPWRRLEFSGAFYAGRNLHHLGVLRQGYVVHPDGRLTAVRSRGGWAQLAFPLTSRLTLNVFGGLHDDRDRDLYHGIGSNRTGAANVQYRLAPNVIVSLEAMQLRTTYLGTGQFKNNRYDLAVAYLF